MKCIYKVGGPFMVQVENDVIFEFLNFSVLFLFPLENRVVMYL